MNLAIFASKSVRWLQRLLALVVSTALILGTMAATPYSTFAQDDPPPSPPANTETPAAPILDAASVDPGRVNYRQIIIKFKSDAGITIGAEGVRSATGADTSSLTGLLQDGTVRPLFSERIEINQSTDSDAKASAGPDLSQYYFLELPDGFPYEAAVEKLQGLQQEASVELAYMEPLYLPAQVPDTDDFTAQQLYLGPAPLGIDALYAQTVTGGSGLNVRVIDIEKGWRFNHEDLNTSSASLIESTNSQQVEWLEHGTAVLGTIAALKNSYGVTGVAPDAELRMISDLSRPLADAINLAASRSRPGDILVIPLQALGPYSGLTCSCSAEECAQFEAIPVEYWQANFDAIRAASTAGLIVVEAAGNGGMNLNSDLYQNLFKRATRDSGALLVGAGDSTADHAPLCSTNYGSRVDLQGWGENIVTTGYGDLPYKAGVPPFGENANRYYTTRFGGSSGATAMVAGAAASLQGIAKKRGFLLNAWEMRTFLRSTGSPQLTSTDRPIGPLPNLKRAIDERVPAMVNLIAPENTSIVTTRRPLLDWNEYFSATAYHLEISTTSTFEELVLDLQTTNTEYQLTTELKNNQTFYWHVCAILEDGTEKGCTNPPWQFTVSAQSVAAPSLLSPKAGAVNTSYRPEFKWKAPAVSVSSPTYPEGYQLQVATRSDFADSSLVINIHQTGLSYIPTSNLNNNSIFYWRVRSYKGYDPGTGVASSYSAWTGRRTLYTAPLPVALTSPGDTSVVDVLRPQLGWDDSAQAKKFQVQVSLNNTFTKVVYSLVITRPAGAVSSPFLHTVQSNLPSSKTLYWRVRVLGNYGWSVWSNIFSFVTGNPPSVPVLRSPADKAVVNKIPDDVTLSWYKSTNKPTGYEIQVATDSKFEDVIDSGSTDATENFYKPAGLEPEKVYYWRVRSFNDTTGTAFYSGWSGARRFYTSPLPPASLVDPTVDSLNVTLDWEKVDVARAYRVQLARSDTFRSTSIIATVTTFNPPPFALPVVLPRNTTVYWRVSALGLYGYSRWSDPGSFDTPDAPYTPALLTPADGTSLRTFNPTLDWQDAAKDPLHPARNAVGYQVQVSRSTSFPDNPAVTVVDEETTASRYTIPAGTITIAGKYYWRVRSINADGAFSVWSAPWLFYTPSILQGTVTDYLSADPGDESDMGGALQYAMVQISGTTWSTITDDEGHYELRGIPAGNYEVVVSKNGFIRQTRQVSIGSGTNATLNFPLVQLPEEGELRIVVTWAKTPADLDAHLWLPKMFPFHLYKNNPGDLDGDEHAALFRNDTNGYGPEVITISQLYAGKYVFAVLMQSSTDTLTTSQAIVTIYDGAKMKKTYLVPTSGTGRWWRVCIFDGSTRGFTDINVLSDTTPAPY